MLFLYLLKSLLKLIKKKRIKIIKNKIKSGLNIVTIKILNIIPIFKIDLDEFKFTTEEKDKDAEKGKGKNIFDIISITKFLKIIINDKDGKLKEIKEELGSYLNKVYIEKFGLNLGFNTLDYVKNSYINASLNSIICLYVNYRRKRFNFNNFYYQVYISDKSYYLNFNSIIKAKFGDTILIIIKLVIFIKKELEADNKKVEEKVWNSIQ